MARTKIRFFRSDTDDLYDDSYANYFYDIWMSYDDVSEDDGTDYACKCRFVHNLSALYSCFDISSVGYEQFYMMEYVRSLKQCIPDEYVLIWHDGAMDSCTVINVTGDSLVAMQRDIMRAVMR